MELLAEDLQLNTSRSLSSGVKLSKKVMSKKSKVGEPTIGYGPARVIYEQQVGYVEGRLLTIIEAIGLKETQEKSIKDLVRSEVWKVIEDSIWISGEDHTKLRSEHRSRLVISNSIPATQ